MSNIIDFLERFGRDAELRSATSEMVEHALQEAGIEPAGRVAILANDRDALEVLLRADSNVCCMIFKEDEEEEEEKEDEEEEEEGDDEDEKALLDEKRTARVA